MMKIIRKDLLYLVIFFCLTGCGIHIDEVKDDVTQRVEAENIAKNYPFTLTENATITQYPADNMYALTSIITDTDGDKHIWVFEFDKNTEREDAKKFARGVQSKTDIYGCNSDVVDVGTSHCYFETNDFFYIYLFYTGTKEVAMMYVENKRVLYFIGEENGQVFLTTAEFGVVVDSQSGDLDIIQRYDPESKEWEEIETKFRPDEYDLGFM